MPKLDQILPCVLPQWERQTVVLAGHPGSHCWSGSQREYLSDLWRCTRPASILPFFMRGGAPWRMAHCWRTCQSLTRKKVMREELEQCIGASWGHSIEVK